VSLSISSSSPVVTFYGWLTEPRAKIKRKMAKGFTKN
jgi:hypothetical protein